MRLGTVDIFLREAPDCRELSVCIVYHIRHALYKFRNAACAGVPIGA